MKILRLCVGNSSVDPLGIVLIHGYHMTCSPVGQYSVLSTEKILDSHVIIPKGPFLEEIISIPTLKFETGQQS